MSHDVKMKRCSRCGQLKPADVEHFQRAAAKKDGLQSVCKECRVTIQKDYREKARMSRAVDAHAANESGVHEAPLTACLLSVDLTDFPAVYKQIEQIAREEDRTPDLQVRHLLRQMFAAAG